MKNIIIVTCLLIFASTARAQPRRAIDRLHGQLTEATDDTSRIKALVSLCSLHRLGNTDSSIFYGTKAIRAAQEIDYPAGEIMALSFMAKPTGEGTGLGLSLSYDIITKGHGGEMKVATKEGEGAEFIIQLPKQS